MSQRLAPRDVLGQTLTELGQENPNIVVLDADFWPASKIAAFKDRFPDRFIEVGIAEQNMMGIAAGLSTVGFTCFASTLCVFCSRRACDQVTTSIALPRLNVKILALYAGLYVGKNGASHQALEDIAIMRSIANMTVVQPADALETQAVLRFAAEYDGPMYIRVGRDPRPATVPADYKFRLGKALTLRDGKDVTLIACGDTVENTLAAAAALSKKGVEARVINMSSIKPIDEQAIVEAAEETGKIVTVDNHNIIGGLGSAVCEVVSEKMPVRVKRIGVKDIFGKSGTNAQMEERFGLRAQDIEDEVMSFLGN
ncbi:MAG TPA: transketolase C-terminal domain-containing protein [Sedimentisphaerales bacterium]|nr:transketolase C-terminal domain-containing protein [Sedimentisphaerales bacterium]